MVKGKSIWICRLAGLLLTFYCVDMSAQEERESPCLTAPAFHQFDWWLGNWVVYEDDEVVGIDTVIASLNSCVVEEKWKRNDGLMGKSFNTYNPATRKWQQIWVDNRGNTFFFLGEYKKGEMTFEGSNYLDGKVVLFKLTYYYRRAEKTVRKLWQVSKDNGKTWEINYDLLFKKSD